MEKEVITLTEDEKKHFFEYCMNEARSSGEIIKQLEKSGVPSEMINRYKKMFIAYMTVADDLDPEKWERVEIDG